MAFDNNARPANVDPEHTLNFEAGIKSYFWNRRAMVDANAYYTKVRRLQRCDLHGLVDGHLGRRFERPSARAPRSTAPGVLSFATNSNVDCD